MSRTYARVGTTVVAAIAVIAALALYATPAEAHHRGGGDDTRVHVSNGAQVDNDVRVRANTGGNDATGGRSGAGGAGGDARGHRGAGGDGGNSGRGGNGGSINTGEAIAVGTIRNDVNHNNLRVEGGDDDDFFPFPRFFRGSDDDTTVTVRNRASVMNDLAVRANTGGNVANGGSTGSGGEGGDAARSWQRWWWWWNNGGEGGNGGTSGGAGTGGTIRTGAAGADGLVVNTVNRNVVRVEGGDDDDNGVPMNI